MDTQATRSKYLSMLLRHKPEKANLELSREGWCSIQELIENTDFTLVELMNIVRDDQKQRYATNPSFGECLRTGEQPTEIRANQGHSTKNVKMTFQKVVPPVVLYHGADDQFIDVIFKKGLMPIKRHHVHLSATVDVAEAVGGRRKNGYKVLEIDAKAMAADGFLFYISENGVYLADHVSAKYLKEHA
jgi:putative RNA 2'-phosphotransferase